MSNQNQEAIKVGCFIGFVIGLAFGLFLMVIGVPIECASTETLVDAVMRRDLGEFNSKHKKYIDFVETINTDKQKSK